MSASSRPVADRNLGRELTALLERRASEDPVPPLLELFRRTAATVPAYKTFLREHGVTPALVRTLADFQQLPFVDKASYVHRHPLAERCRDGRLSSAQMIAVSSGSTGEPTAWARSSGDEREAAVRFEQIFHDSFRIGEQATLAVICFPLGTWVGGMYTTACCRHLASMGYPITVIAPGNNKAEILRVVRSLAPQFEQTVLLGYPPFLKDVVDAGLSERIAWSRHRIKLVLAGEVFSEEWRNLMAERAGMRSLVHDSAALYGTADAGVLGNETPLSITVRRFLGARPDAARALFGDARLPTLVQFDPHHRYFEEHEGTLVFSGDGAAPLVRYRIGDSGGVIEYGAMMERLAELGFPTPDVTPIRALPFLYLFGRSQFAVSFYGANVFPDTVAIALEQPDTRDAVTGKFVLEVREDELLDKTLAIDVELAAGAQADPALASRIAGAVSRVLSSLDSEFAHYVPEARKRPEITLWPMGHPEYFPVGVKHRYSRR